MKPKERMLWSEPEGFPATPGLHDALEEGRIKVEVARVGRMSKVEVGRHWTFEVHVVSSSSPTVDEGKTATTTLATLEADVVVFATGWRTGSYPFFTRSEQEELGLPVEWMKEKPEREGGFEKVDEQSAKELRGWNRCFNEAPWAKEGTATLKKAEKKVAPFRVRRFSPSLLSLHDSNFVVLTALP
jgi:hypothetical protein